MKSIAVALLSLAAWGCCGVRCPCPAAPTVRLFPICPYGKCGYIDATGDVTIEPRFDHAGFFQGDRAIIGIRTSSSADPEGSTWAFLDARGNTTAIPYARMAWELERTDFDWWHHYGISPEDPTPFEGKNGLWGLRKGGAVLLPPTYGSITLFGGGLAQARHGAELVYLDRAGRVVWEPHYPLELGKADWQFDESKAGFDASVAAHDGPYWFAMARANDFWLPLGTLEIRRGEICVACVRTHTLWGTVFLVRDHTLYYADPVAFTTGCTAGAVDLHTGRHLWRTHLKALSPYGVSHSLYNGEANLRMQDGYVYVSCSEHQGDYVEALDPKTGKIVGRYLVPWAERSGGLGDAD